VGGLVCSDMFAWRGEAVVKPFLSESIKKARFPQLRRNRAFNLLPPG